MPHQIDSALRGLETVPFRGLGPGLVKNIAGEGQGSLGIPLLLFILESRPNGAFV